MSISRVHPSRRVLQLSATAALLLVARASHAQQPLEPYEGDAVVAPAPPAVVVVPPAPPAPPPAPPQAPSAPPPAYGGQYPTPPAYGYQYPQSGPGVVSPAPPAYQQGYYLYPGQNQAPVYYAPPPPAGAARTCPTYCARPVRKPDGVRRFSLGVHAAYLGVNQSVGASNVNLGGFGFQLRLRSKGRFGFEMAQDILHGEFWNGRFVRDSFPFSTSLMFYLFENNDARHFNIYGLAGFGLMLDSVQVYDENRRHVTQDFTELFAHVGVGAELRFKWFALEADARMLGLMRDDSDTPAMYYSGVSGGPVPASGVAFLGTLAASVWF